MSLLGEAKTPQERIDGFFLGGGDHGHLTLTVEKPLSAAAYETMRSGVEAHPTTTAGFWKDSVLRLDSELPTPNEHDIAGTEEALDIPQAGTGRGGAFFKLSPEATRDSSTTDRHEHVSGTEWYPPLPQNAGFNVFGPMTALTIGSAVGNLSVAGHPRAIDTPESLRLTDLHDLRDASSQQSVVSVPMTVASNAAISSLPPPPRSQLVARRSHRGEKRHSAGSASSFTSSGESRPSSAWPVLVTRWCGGCMDRDQADRWGHPPSAHIKRAQPGPLGSDDPTHRGRRADGNRWLVRESLNQEPRQHPRPTWSASSIGMAVTALSRSRASFHCSG